MIDIYIRMNLNKLISPLLYKSIADIVFIKIEILAYLDSIEYKYQ